MVLVAGGALLDVEKRSFLHAGAILMPLHSIRCPIICVTLYGEAVLALAFYTNENQSV